MKDDMRVNVSIDNKRLRSLMDKGHGKRYDRLKSMIYPSNDPVFDPEAVIEKIEGHDEKKWKQTELAAVTGIDRQTIGKLYNNTYSTKTGNNYSTIKRIAEALDVDVEYLTGEQRKMKKPTQDQYDKIQLYHDRISQIKHSERMKALADITHNLSDPGIAVNWRIDLHGEAVPQSDPESPEIFTEKWLRKISEEGLIYTSFDLYNRDGDLICKNRDISDLEPFIQAMEHLLQLGNDIADHFLNELQDPEE